MRQRSSPRGAGEVVEADPNRDGAPDPAGVAHPAGDPVDDAQEQRLDRLGRLAATPERLLRPDRAAALAGDDRPRIAVVGERVEVATRADAEHRDEVSLSQHGDLAHGDGCRGRATCARSQGRRPTGGRPGAGGGTRARDRVRPPAGHRAWRRPLATLARNFVRATPTVIGNPTSRSTSARRRDAIAAGVPAIRHRPPTSRNASSIDSPSTSGVTSWNTSNTALLASV